MSFGPLCPQCDLSVVYWDRTDCAIVDLECQMLSASWTTKTTKQFWYTPWNMWCESQRVKFIGKALFTLLWHREWGSMIDVI